MRMQSDDKNEDGYVSWDEYLESTYGMTEEELEKHKSEDLEDKDSKATMEKVCKQKHIKSTCIYTVHVIKELTH